MPNATDGNATRKRQRCCHLVSKFNIVLSRKVAQPMCRRIDKSFCVKILLFSNCWRRRTFLLFFFIPSIHPMSVHIYTSFGGWILDVVNGAHARRGLHLLKPHKTTTQFVFTVARLSSHSHGKCVIFQRPVCVRVQAPASGCLAVCAQRFYDQIQNTEFQLVVIF